MFLVLAYIVAIPVKKLVFEKEEIFPIFNWSLFSKMPDRENKDIVLLVREVDGLRLTPPVDLMFSAKLNKTPNDITLYYVIQGLGDAVLKEQHDREQIKNDLIVRNFMKGFHKNMKYEIGRRTSNPIQQFQTGGYEFEKLKGYVVEKD